MPKQKLTLVFVHGWSVTNTDTYGGLPARLRNEAAARNVNIEVKHLYLGRYISFHDEVTVPDIARAFQAAVDDELSAVTAAGNRFACITHSTGGPVIREWWYRHYFTNPHSGRCPMSHLMMLAPANFGSALAQLGKGRLSRLKNWFGGTEPGQGVLNWLELGSRGSWALNSAWIADGESSITAKGVFPFVLTGQTIDRAFYDNLNSYTGETGSDGVVRVAAANLNSRIVHLEQEKPRRSGGADSKFEAPNLVFRDTTIGPQTAMRIISGASHSGSSKGIMRSVRRPAGHARGRELVDSLFDCLQVSSRADYLKVVDKQAAETDQVQEEERLETDKKFFVSDTHFVHDRYSMVTFRVTDDEGHAVKDFDLLLTAGPNNDPNHLPKGFFVDRQSNKVARNSVTFYFNYDVMVGAPEITKGDKVVRAASDGAASLGIILKPRPDRGFVHYLPCEIKADEKMLAHVAASDPGTKESSAGIRLRSQTPGPASADRPSAQLGGSPGSAHRGHLADRRRGAGRGPTDSAGRSTGRDARPGLGPLPLCHVVESIGRRRLRRRRHPAART